MKVDRASASDRSEGLLWKIGFSRWKLKGADALDRRPQLAAALAAARAAKCSVLVSKLDRLSRDVAFVAGLMAPARAPCARGPRWPSARQAGTSSAIPSTFAKLGGRPPPFSFRPTGGLALSPPS